MIIRTFYFLTLGICLLFLINCGHPQKTSSSKHSSQSMTTKQIKADVHNTKITWSIGPIYPGENSATLELKDYPSNDPSHKNSLKVHFSMPECCEFCVADPIVTTTLSPDGSYQLSHFKFTMPGKWKLSIQVFQDEQKVAVIEYNDEIEVNN